MLRIMLTVLLFIVIINGQILLQKHLDKNQINSCNDTDITELGAKIAEDVKSWKSFATSAIRNTEIPLTLAVVRDKILIINTDRSHKDVTEKGCYTLLKKTIEKVIDENSTENNSVDNAIKSYLTK